MKNNWKIPVFTGRTKKWKSPLLRWRSQWRRGFTLIELVVAVAILSIIMLSVFVIYSNLVSVNRKLEQTRILQEQTRLITETIAADVRGNGIGIVTGKKFGECDDSFMGEQKKCLRTKQVAQYYLQQKTEDGANYGACQESVTKIPCQLVSAQGEPITSDAVDVRDLSFLVTGTSGSGATNESIEGKVQLSFRIGIAPRKWVSSEIIKNSFITVQTTISEKIYKSN